MSREMDASKDEINKDEINNDNTENTQNTMEFSTPEEDKQETPSTWADDAKENAEDVVEIPDAIALLYRNGMRFRTTPKYLWGSEGEDHRRLHKKLSVYFSVDTVCTSQEILEAFDKAQFDIDQITAIQRKASNKTWVISFDTLVAKEEALQLASLEICGCSVFIGDCENRLVLVKIYEAPNEMPDTVVIGRLSCYGQVLSFRRDLIAQGVYNGVRTARMRLTRHIPSSIFVAGDILRVWYPTQPKTCRNCGSEDHMVKDCNSTRCHNCEEPGHSKTDCPELPLCTVCMSPEHDLITCPFVVYSANVEVPSKSTPKEEKTHASATKPSAEKPKEKPRSQPKKDSKASDNKPPPSQPQQRDRVRDRDRETDHDRDHNRDRDRDRDRNGDRDRNRDRDRDRDRDRERDRANYDRDRERDDYRVRQRREREYERFRHRERDRSRFSDGDDIEDYTTDEDRGWKTVRYRRGRLNFR